MATITIIDEKIDKNATFGSLDCGEVFSNTLNADKYIKIDEYTGFNLSKLDKESFHRDHQIVPRKAEIIFK